ncbi:hypothetical protein [Paenibacillus eucommiae]|uniref:Uncharacterized protein n=1 Tax=Paenibacillus eucommiae TaxID=1355755 RepID=A0ABS4IYT2_9BACL|nr:hypothetical protein [Paenibacillus eucommiae]MBP1992753.1 hypothetical protein [Paenibacillus eucommiae]
MQYFIYHNGKKLSKAMTKEEAIMELFNLRGSFTDLSILIVDEETGKIKGEIKNKKRKK